MISFEATEELRQMPSTSSVAVQRLVRRFKSHAATAREKEYVSDLTEDEACAICFFAGVPYVFDGGKMKFNPCGLMKRNGQWTAFLPPNSQDRTP